MMFNLVCNIGVKNSKHFLHFVVTNEDKGPSLSLLIVCFSSMEE